MSVPSSMGVPYRPQRPPLSLSLMLMTECTEARQDFLEGIIRQWLADGPAQVGGELWAGLQAREFWPGDIAKPAGTNSPYIGSPGDVWCRYAADENPDPENPEDPRYRLAGDYTPGGFEEFIAHLGLPTSAHVDLSRLKYLTSTKVSPGETVNLSVTREKTGDTEYLTFLYFADYEFAKGSANQSNVLALARRAAEQLNPVYGEIHHGVNVSRSKLESKIRPTGEHPPDPRQVLRGYGWLTVAPQEIGDQLGGTVGLAAAGAFAEVAQLEHGGYWLLATPDFESYDMEAATKVWNALRRFLPTGVPTEDAPWDWPSLLVSKDASVES